MTKNKKKIIEQEIDCDTTKLYDRLDIAIAYLQEIKNKYKGIDIHLDEHWTGYEDMEMRFVYNREETDEEFNDRIEHEKYMAEMQRKLDEEAAARNERRKKYEALKREFG